MGRGWGVDGAAACVHARHASPWKYFPTLDISVYLPAISPDGNISVGYDALVVTEHGTLSRYTNAGCRCDACRAAMAEYKRQRQQARATTPPPPPEHFHVLPDGELASHAHESGEREHDHGLGTLTGSMEHGNDDDKACPTCGEVHEVLDDEEAPGDGGQGRERPESETGTPKPEPASTAEPTDPLLHMHQHKPDGVPMHHAHDGGDKPHQHKAVRKTVTTTGYRAPKPATAPKTVAKAPVKRRVLTQATPVGTPAKGAARRPIVTTAWHAHRMAGAPDERKGER